MASYIYDLAQLIHQQELAPVAIVAHSLGGNIASRYAGIYPEAVRRLVVIEGIGPPPRPPERERHAARSSNACASGSTSSRSLSGRLPRRYATIEDALRRMQEENPHLSAEQARHLTQHGVNQNEDGTYSWKFDNYVRVWPPYDMTRDEIASLWSQIACPTLLVYGKESWAKNRRTMAAPAISAMPASWASTAQATGSITISWTSSCARFGRSWPDRQT